jgi:IS605 OrfB family transposase
MKITATLRIKLMVSPETAEALEKTQAAYVQALNQTSTVAFERSVKNPVALHHMTYRDVREATGLPANLVCSARSVVAEAYKREIGKLHWWKDDAGVRYDARTFTLRADSETVSLTTLGGRVKVGLVISGYHRPYFDGTWTFVKTTTLCYKGKKWYLHLVARKEVEDATGGGVLGVDFGIKRVAVTSTGKIFRGGTITQTRRRRFKQRRSLKVGHKRSRGKRRLLKRLTGRERRAVEWMLWNVANGIVREAVEANCSTIAVEDLKHIRTRIRVAKKQRLIQYGWPFASLQTKVRHVASRHGIQVVEVDAKNTSRTCRCGHVSKSNRPAQALFRCISCGYQHNADILAAFNIRQRYVSDKCGSVNTRSMPATPGGVAGQSFRL